MQLVILSEVKWSYMRTRKRFIAERLPETWSILFLEPINLSAPARFWPRRHGRVTVMTVPVARARTTVPWINRLLNLGWVRWWIDWLLTAWLWVALAWVGRRRPRAFYLSNVLAMRAARRQRRDFLFYDCNDDPLGFRGTPAWVADYLDDTLREADQVVACSTALADRLAARGRHDVEVIGNGVDFEHFATGAADAPLHPVLAETEPPLIGYAGAISTWFDFALVGQVAERHREATVVLMGPVYPEVLLEAEALARRCPNVRFTGSIRYETLPRHVRALDVCLIPFRLSDVTDVLNPNKLYEYLAAGRSVVTLNYSRDVVAFAGSVWVTQDAEAFAEAVGAALARPQQPAALQAVARRYSWEARAQAIQRLVSRGVGLAVDG